MRHPLRVITALLFMIAVTMISLHAQNAVAPATVNSSAAETTDDAKQSTGQSDSYRLKKGDNEFGFWGGAAFQATTIFGGLHADEASGRRFVILALRYGRTLAATKNYALQYTLDAVPLPAATGNIGQRMTGPTPVATVTTLRLGPTSGAGPPPL